MTNNLTDDFQTFKSAITRIYNSNEAVVGAGFLVSSQYLLTCAHVVTAALGLPKETTTVPMDSIKLDFPLTEPGKILEAKVDFWRPYQSEKITSPNQIGDLAGLKLQSEIPDNVQPIHLISSENVFDHPFRIYGFPTGHRHGIWADGVFKDTLANGWVQVQGTDTQGHRVQPGFSGAPIWDNSENGVVGMVVAAETNETRQVAFLLPTKVLISAWLELSTLQSPLISSEFMNPLNVNNNYDNLDKDFNSLTGSEKKEFVQQVLSYYDDVEAIQNLFIFNEEVFGRNFLSRIRGNNPQSKMVNLIQELTRKNLMNDFVKICREEYPDFAKEL